MSSIGQRTLKDGPGRQKEQRSNGPADQTGPDVSLTGAMWLFEIDRGSTYRTANLRGRSDSTGNKKKQIIKHAAAPRLQAEKASKRSNRLTSIGGGLAGQELGFLLFGPGG